MTLTRIELNWFRGAGASGVLETEGRSVVVFGRNGSGKSSFVDGVEYAIRHGRIGHLEHEYSGRKQEKGVPNTHKPRDVNHRLYFEASGGNSYEVIIDAKGNATRTENGLPMAEWNYASVVLRQDEVSAFIHSTKKDKYSALLPLLGLMSLETAAENLRQLAKFILEDQKVAEAKHGLELAKAALLEQMGRLDDNGVLDRVNHQLARHGRTPVGRDAAALALLGIEKDLKGKLKVSGDESRRYVLLRSFPGLGIGEGDARLQAALSAFAETATEALDAQLRIHEAAERLLAASPNDIMECPVCGQAVARVSMQEHLAAEGNRLEEARKRRADRDARFAEVCEQLQELRVKLKDEVVAEWKSGLRNEEQAALEWIVSLQLSEVRAKGDAAPLIGCSSRINPLLNAAAVATAIEPPGAAQLASDLEEIAVLNKIVIGWSTEADVNRVESVVAYVRACESAVRNEIVTRAQATIREISVDVQAVWSILRPGSKIDNIELEMPEATDKAIDIRLKFHGVEQESPRLTLSEGNRNSLGLSIFLSMAKRADPAWPLVLDDVVVSLDREHRGMIADVLTKLFVERQVIVFTHDRDWFADLRQQLDARNWCFKRLLPYSSPDLGLRFADSPSGFSDARTLAISRPDSAANDARKIMDVEMAVIGEKLRLRLPFRRADGNDRRGAHDFLERIVGDRKCLEVKDGARYIENKEGIEAIRRADQLLTTCGNRGSHTFDVVEAEALQIVDTCEAAVSVFECTVCHTSIWHTNIEDDNRLRCDCGRMRWKYR